GKRQHQKKQKADSRSQKTSQIPASNFDKTTLLSANSAQRQQLLSDFLQKQTARILGMEPSQINPDQPLDTMGLDSLMAMELKNSLESKLGVNLSVASLLQGPTLSRLVSEALENLDA